MYLPFRPIKGQAFNLHFTTFDIIAGVTPGTGALSYCDISKDGGTFAATTNTPTIITASSNATSAGRFYVTLTATEMNADIIDIAFRNINGPTYGTVTIYTTTAELAAVPTLNSSIADKITAIFQYLFFKRTVTSSTETLFKSDSSTTLGSDTVSDNGTTFTKGIVS